MQIVNSQFFIHSIPLYVKDPICMDCFKKYYLKNHCPTGIAGSPTQHLFTYYVAGKCTRTSVPLLGINVYIEFAHSTCFIAQHKVSFGGRTTNEDFYTTFTSRQDGLEYIVKAYKPILQLINDPESDFTIY